MLKVCLHTAEVGARPTRKVGTRASQIVVDFEMLNSLNTVQAVTILPAIACHIKHGISLKNTFDTMEI